MTILSIETSCDDTSVAVIKDGSVLVNLISSQPEHNEWGGIVPEIASREHTKIIGALTQVALRKSAVELEAVDAIAVTNGPGLAGSLLVGTSFAKGLSVRFGIPVIPINHIEAHVYSGYLEHPTLEFPTVCLVVSGGHTIIVRIDSFTSYEVLGSTRDDAAGEAFDKIAKLMGLGYPGGPIVDRLARTGDANLVDFPQGLLHDSSYDFSFSGLKTAVRYYLRDHPRAEIADVCASAQRAIVSVLTHKTMAAAEHEKVRAVVVAGGVSANSELRSQLGAACEKAQLQFVAPRSEYCVDNAAMIGFLAAQKLHHEKQTHADKGLSFVVDPKPLRASR